MAQGGGNFHIIFDEDQRHGPFVQQGAPRGHKGVEGGMGHGALLLPFWHLFPKSGIAARIASGVIPL